MKSTVHIPPLRAGLILFRSVGTGRCLQHGSSPVRAKRKTSVASQHADDFGSDFERKKHEHHVCMMSSYPSYCDEKQLLMTSDAMHRTVTP